MCLQVVVRPGDENEAYDVYVQYDIRPNLTHYEYADSVPKADLSHLEHLESLATLAPEIQEELLYTITVPSYLTMENGTYWVGIKLKSKCTASLTYLTKPHRTTSSHISANPHRTTSSHTSTNPHRRTSPQSKHKESLAYLTTE